MGHGKFPDSHSWAHTVTPGWMPITKSFIPHLEEPSKYIILSGFEYFAFLDQNNENIKEFIFLGVEHQLHRAMSSYQYS